MPSNTAAAGGVHMGREQALGGPSEPAMDIKKGPIVSNVKILPSGLPASPDGSNPGAMVDTVTFDVENVTPAIANTLRRVLMTEVPTMAIDRVLIQENEGVVLDEILSHRLGLVPIVAPLEEFEYLTSAEGCDFNLPDAKKVIQFELKVSGSKEQLITPVYSSHLKFVPLPGQEHLVGKVHVVHQDILLAKLGCGQRIDLKCFALKGLGQSHAKWQPVSACFYDMKTQIGFTKPVSGDDAQLLKKICPMKVFDIEDSGDAFVKKASKCTVCRECVRSEYPFANSVVVEKLPTFFHFTVESTGQYHAADVVRNGLRIFSERCRALKETVAMTNVQVAGINPTAQQVVPAAVEQ